MGLLSDAARLLRLAEGVGANSLDDLGSLGRVRGVRLIPVLQRDLLNEVGGVIKARAQRRLDLRREGSQPRRIPNRTAWRASVSPASA